MTESYRQQHIDECLAVIPDEVSEWFFCTNMCPKGGCWCNSIGEPELPDSVGLIDRSPSDWPAYDKMDAEIRPVYGFYDFNDYIEEHNPELPDLMDDSGTHEGMLEHYEYPEMLYSLDSPF